MHTGPAVPLTDPIRGSSEAGRLWTLTNVGEATPDSGGPVSNSLPAAACTTSECSGARRFGYPTTRIGGAPPASLADKR
jgi:hypothetical protein